MVFTGIDDFLDNVTVLPPGEWDPNTRIEPPKSVPDVVSDERKLIWVFLLDLLFRFAIPERPS